MADVVWSWEGGFYLFSGPLVNPGPQLLQGRCAELRTGTSVAFLGFPRTFWGIFTNCGRGMLSDSQMSCKSKPSEAEGLWGGCTLAGWLLHPT